MTKKNWISIAAASALTAGMMTGCGSSSSGSSGTTTTTTSGVQSSVKAVDGYIYNAKVEGFYLGDDNKTLKSVELTADDTTKDVATGDITVGESTYTLSDANSSIQQKLRFFKVSKVASSTEGTTFTPATYIEADGKDGYDSNDSLLGATTIYAPANSAIASPLTNLVYQANKGTLGDDTVGALATAGTDFNATYMASLEANATKIATNLGLGDVDLFAADPIEMAESNPTLKLVTAMLKGADAADAATILAETPATSLAETLDIVAKATSGATKGATLAGQLATLAKNGSFTTANIAEMNIEKSVENQSYTTLTAPTLEGSFALSGIQINSVDSDEFYADGAKVQNDQFNVDLNMSHVSSDANITNSSFELYVKVEGHKASMETSEDNASAAVAFKVPFDMNLTDGEVNGKIADDALVPFQAKASDGSQIAEVTDTNASTLGITSAIDFTSNTKIPKIKINDMLVAVVSAAEDNITAGFPTGTGMIEEISSVSVYLKDVDGKVIGVMADDKTNSMPLAKGTFSDIGLGNLSASEALKVIDTSVVDMRANDLDGENSAPSIDTLDAEGDDSEDVLVTNESNASLADGADLSTYTVVVNKGVGSTNLIVNVESTDEGEEDNTTVELSGLPTYVTNNSGALDLGAANAEDFNLTIDGNASISAEATTVAKVKTTDEFGKTSASNDENLTFFFNLAPALASGKSITSVNDANSTGVTYAAMFTNLNGADGTCTVNDENSTDAVDCAVTADGNLTITDTTDTNETYYVDFTVSDAYGASADFNATAVTNNDE